MGKSRAGSWEIQETRGLDNRMGKSRTGYVKSQETRGLDYGVGKSRTGSRRIQGKLRDWIMGWENPGLDDGELGTGLRDVEEGIGDSGMWKCCGSTRK
jgi:hypothetical protein